MKFTSAVFFVLLATSTFAAVDESLFEQDFIVAVPTAAPASDVVFAANFAQTMKANTRAAFVGATQEDVKDTFHENDYAERFVVFMNGDEKTATVLSGDSRKDREVFSAAAEYLRARGYDVTQKENAPARTEAESRVVEESVEPEQTETASETTEEQTETPKPLSVTAVPETPKEQPAQDNQETTQPVAVITDKEPSGLTRFWNWIKNIFG